MKKCFKIMSLCLGLLVFSPPTGYSEESIIRDFRIENETSESNLKESVLSDPTEILFLAIYGVESRYTHDTINTRENAYGGLQIRQILLDDYYQWTGIRITLEQTLNLSVAKSIFMFYAELYGDSKDLQRISRKWNGGAKGMQKESTKAYWIKIQHEIETIKKQMS